MDRSVAMVFPCVLFQKPNDLEYNRVRLDDKGFIPQDLVERGQKKDKKGKVKLHLSFNLKLMTVMIRNMN